MKEIDPFKQYVIKHKKKHKFTFRPEEYYENPTEYDISAAICSVANLDLLQFSYGADILEHEVRKDKNILVDRSILWDVPENISKVMEYFRELPKRGKKDKK
ncbi:MAG: hypothetical protein K9J21_07050 [Bacteroidales bacterium]|nr:hypothetical protein [Bacteroidales bacterium]